MVVLTILAVIGIAAIFAVGYYLVVSKCPKIGDKICDFVEKVGSSFKRRKDSETVEDLNKLDK